MNNNKTKAITVRMTEEEFTLLNHYRELIIDGGMRQQDFVREAIKEKIERVKFEELQGGKYILVENLVNKNISKFEIKEDIKIMVNCYKELIDSNSELSFSVVEIINYLNDLYYKEYEDVKSNGKRI